MITKIAWGFVIGFLVGYDVAVYIGATLPR